MSALIEAAQPGQRFSFAQALSRGTAPTCPGRSDSPLEPIGDTWLGDKSPQLAAALQRRYPALKIKALYAGNPSDGTLEHTVAYDPQTDVAHDARGTFPTTAAAFADFGAGADRTVTRDEPPTTAIDPDADAYVERNWGPYENGSGQLGNLDADPDPDGDELDALLGGEPRAQTTGSRVLDESALTLLEAIWNEKLHPRWPPGSKSPTGKHIAGEFMRVGQRFDKDGHEWEIGHIAGSQIIAHEASGDVSKAETRVFDTKTVGDVEHALPGATPSAPRILRSGFQKLNDSQANDMIKNASSPGYTVHGWFISKSGSTYTVTKPDGTTHPGLSHSSAVSLMMKPTKTAIPNENSLIVDADRHEETHDPSIQPNPLSKLTPEQWSHFGLVDQLYYNSVMEHFGAWQKPNGQHPPPISASGSQWQDKLAAIQHGVPPTAVSTFQHEVSSLKGETRGNQLSGTGVFRGLMNDPAKLAAAQEKYAQFREYEGDVNALIAWDLYNRHASPDITVIHRANGNEVFKKVLSGDLSVLSGLSTSWKTGSWSEPHHFVFALPVRQVAFFETLLGQGWGAGSGESELANVDRLKIGKLAGYYLGHEIEQPGYSSGKGQAVKMFNWLTGQLNENGHGGALAGMLKKHFNKDDSFAVDLGQVDANFKVTKKAGEKTYFIPPDNVMAAIEEKVSANPGHPAWDEQKSVSSWPEDMKAKPGMIIEKGGQQAGTRYLVIQNDGLGPGQIQYVPLLTGSGDYNVNPTGGGYFTNKAKVILGDDGKPLFFPLPPQPDEGKFHHDMASLSPSGPKMQVGTMQVGDKVTINNDHWQITDKSSTLVHLQSLSDGTEATVESMWPTQKLYPTGQGVPDTGPTFKPEVGQSAIYHLFAGDQIVNVESVNPDDNTKFGEHGSVEIKFPNGSTKTVGAISLTEAPTLPKLTPQKGDTFAADGFKHTVTNVMKNGTVSARPFIPGGPTQKVKQFPPDAPELAGLVRPGDYQHGEKAKLGSMEPGTLVSGSPSVVRPYMVLGTTGTKTHLKNLDTGEVSTFSKNKSYPTLTSKYALPATTAHDQWVTGEKVNVSDLQVGDKFQMTGGQPLTVTGEATQQGQVGWQYESSTGTTGWIPKDLGEDQSVKATYLGKAEPTTPAAPSVEPLTLQDAVSSGEMEPFYTLGPAQSPNAQISNLSEGQHFYDQAGKLWKVKQSGQTPIITTGETLYTVKGTYYGKPSLDTLHDQTAEEVGPSFAKPESEPAVDLTPNTTHQTLANLKLQPGDKIDSHGHVWTIQSGSPEVGYTATADDAAITKQFLPFLAPISYQKAEPTPDADDQLQAQDAASEFLDGAGHTPTMIQKLQGKAAVNVVSKKYPPGWAPSTKWAQAYADAYVDTYEPEDGEDQANQMANELFSVIKDATGGMPAAPPATEATPSAGLPQHAQDAADEFLHDQGYNQGSIDQIHGLAVTHHDMGKSWPDAYEAAHINMKGFTGAVALNEKVKEALATPTPSAEPTPAALPPFLQTYSGETAPAHVFDPNELAQRADGTLVYLKHSIQFGDQWTEVGGGDVSVFDNEKLLPLKLTSIPATAVKHTGQKEDIHDIPAGQTFFASGDPWIVVGHGPAGATAKSLENGTILDAPAGQHGQFELGSMRAGSPAPGPAEPPPTVEEPSIPGSGIHPAMSLVKGHHMKIKTDGKGAEYEVLQTPNPGDKTIQVQTIKGKKVYDWAHYNKNILITKAPPVRQPPPAPPPPAPPAGLKPNPGDSMTELGLQKGDFFGEGGNKIKVMSVTPLGIMGEDQNGITTTVHKDFVPETYLKTSPAKQVDANGTPLEPGDPVIKLGSGGYTYVGPDPSDPSVATLHDDLGGGMTTTASLASVEKGTPLPELEPAPAPSAPIPAYAPKTFADLNVGDKYKLAVSPTEWEVTNKTPTTVTVKGVDTTFEDTLPTDTPFAKTPTITYKAPPPTGGNAAGQLGGMPSVADMPIDPYLWGKSGSGTYDPITKLNPGEQFSDKSGAKYTVVKHNVKKLEDATGTTTVQGPGGTFEVPHQFANKKGKTTPTRVNKLATTAPVPEFIAAEPEKPEVPGHLTTKQASDTLTNAATAGGVHTTNGWNVFKFGDGSYSIASPDGTTHTGLTHDQAHNWMVHGTDPAPTPPAPSEKPWSELRVGDLIKAPVIPLKVTADHDTHWEVTSINDGSVTDLPKASVGTVEVTGHESKTPTWAKLRVGDQIGVGDNPAKASHKITADLGDQWEVTTAKGGNAVSAVNKTATSKVTVFGHESQEPSVADSGGTPGAIAQSFVGGGTPGNWAPLWHTANVNGNTVFYHGHGDSQIPVAYRDPAGTIHVTPVHYKPEINDVVFSIKSQAPDHVEAASQLDLDNEINGVGQKVAPYELGVGDVFANPEGDHFQIVSKNLVDTLHFEKLSGSGADSGDLYPDAPVKYTLVSKAADTPPEAEIATALPGTTDDVHFTAINTADQWMLNHDVPSKTANWVHAQATKYQQQNPGVTWGDAYKATTPTTNPESLKDALDQALPPAEPIIEKVPPATPKPAAGEMPDYTGTDLTPLGSAGGTTGAQLATDPSGKQWLIKSYAGNEDRVATELLANSVYRAVGHDAADAGTLVQNGKTKLAYPLVDGSTKHWSGTDQAKMQALGQGVMTDALVGNWDFAGLEDDNVLWNGDKPTRIDQGGTFQYRAQGKSKPYGPVPVEVKSLLTGGGQGVKGVSVSEDGLRQQAAHIAQELPPEKIDQLVDAAPFADQKMKDEIRTNLKARVQWMQEFADGQHSDMVSGVNLAPSISSTPTPEPGPGDDVTPVTPVTHSTAELDYPGSPTLGLAAAKNKIGDAVSSPGQIVDLGNGASVLVRANDKGFLFKASDGKRYSVEAGKSILAIKVARAISKPTQPLAEPPTPPTPPEPPSYAAKYQVGHKVSYGVAGGGTKTGTIIQDASLSATQHAYKMNNGDTVDEHSIGGLAPDEEPQPKPQWTPEPSGTPAAPHIEDMPIDPYLWPKGGIGKAYHPIASLKPGDEFADKKGTKHRVVSASNGVTVAELLAHPGETVAIPHSFIAKSGKVHPTRVNVG